MNTAVAQKAHVPDVAGQITYAMRCMGVPPIPRNYELFYEAYIGSNPALTRDLAALGAKVTQEDLDALATQHIGTPHNRLIEDVHTNLGAQLESVMRVLRQEQMSLESYNRLLSETFDRINSKNSASVDLIESIIKLLSDATDTTLSHGERTVQNVVHHSREMDRVRKELDEYKRIANTDSLTRLANRRAFDDRLAAIFNNPTLKPLTALVLVDIDNFKRINDTYGHPVGDKILATVASVIRANVRRDVFVARTGGEEFALIANGQTAEEVMEIVERIRRTLESTPFKNSRTKVDYGPVTASIGVCMASLSEDAGELYSKTDIALYCAKNAGKNCSVLFEEGMQKDFSKGWLIYKSEQRG